MTSEQIKLEVNHIFESGANEIRVIEMIERLLPKWISVNDRLPNKGEEVLCFWIEDEIKWHELGTLIDVDADGVTYWTGDECIEIRPTHWQPLTPPPTK